ncbi:MAG TPA: hypothetical protein VHP11_00775 [Tepidisphaeraceae bacterium]|nr:hypothetical protein [Tepidisphaeraceae bacterium]
MVARPDPDEPNFDGMLNLATPTPLSQSEHLLKVAASVAQDASKVWAEMWSEFKPHVTHGGVIHADMQKGFVPSCGWSEYLEKFWLLKHYLDSIDRICKNKR